MTALELKEYTRLFTLAKAKEIVTNSKLYKLMLSRAAEGFHSCRTSDPELTKYDTSQWAELRDALKLLGYRVSGGAFYLEIDW